MGGDGGSVPKRIELVKTSTRKNTDLDKNLKKHAWFKCFLSDKALKEPVVGCSKGHLYNKEAILHYLLDLKKENKIDPRLSHIASLKCTKQLNLTRNPAHRTNEDSAPFLCPITQEEMNGLHLGVQFVFLWTCGCVFSDKALKNMSESSACFVCGQSFNRGNRWSAKFQREAKGKSDALIYTTEYLNKVKTQYTLLELGDVVIINPNESQDVIEAEIRAKAVLASLEKKRSLDSKCTDRIKKRVRK